MALRTEAELLDNTPTVLDIIKDTIADNRNLSDSLRRMATMMSGWDDKTDCDPKFRKMVEDSIEGARLIAEYDAMIEEKVEGAVKSFKNKTRVRVVGEQIGWGGETKIPVGLVGTVVSKRAAPYPDPPKGRTAVKFKSSDVGFMMDEDYPDDHYENTMIFYLWNFTLEVAEEGAQSIVPEPRKWTANPAPEGQRWAIIWDRNGKAEEIGGHCCGCYEEMVEYTQAITGRVELRPRYTSGYEMAYQVLT